MCQKYSRERYACFDGLLVEGARNIWEYIFESHPCMTLKRSNLYIFCLHRLHLSCHTHVGKFELGLALWFLFYELGFLQLRNSICLIPLLIELTSLPYSIFLLVQLASKKMNESWSNHLTWLGTQSSCLLWLGLVCNNSNYVHFMTGCFPDLHFNNVP